MRLNLGSGNNLVEGAVNVDKFDNEADVLADMADLNYPDDSVEEITIYQALEHTPWHQLDDILTNCHRMLQPGGKLIIEVPDLEYVFKKILEEGLTQHWHDNIFGGYHRPWDAERYPDHLFHQGSIHYQGFNYGKLYSALFKVGFRDIRVLPMAEKQAKYEENLAMEAIK